MPLHRRRRPDRRGQDEPRARACAADFGGDAARATGGKSVPRALLRGHGALRAAHAAQFPFQRVDQLTGVGQLDMFRRAIVGDFLLDKDPLFARLNLSDAEYRLYEKVYSHLKLQTATPDLVVYLQAPVATLVERVHRRGVDYERTISEHYLARIADAYSRYFYQYDAAPLLIVNSERLNFVANRDHVDLLLARIGTMRGRREFFNLGQPAFRCRRPPLRTRIRRRCAPRASPCLRLGE